MNFIDEYNPLEDEPIQILDAEGNVVLPDVLPKWSPEKLREIYEKMVFLRMADRKLINLQRQGRCGTYAPLEGQEACQVGSALALEKTDMVFPAFRELGISFMHGVPLEKIYLYWMGDEKGSLHDANVAPHNIVVGAHALHAAGYAWGLKMQKKNGITISYFGDGATSTGDFYEALNFAGVFKIPTIFLCQNNQWAISVPRSHQTAAKTLAQKGLACAVPGIQVDGNDVFAMFAVTYEAATRAREGLGATLIEAVTYRFGNHTTSDEAVRYRNEKEVDFWRLRDPLLRYKLFLQKKNLWDDTWQKQIEKTSQERISEAAEIAEKTPAPEPTEIFDYLYKKPTPQLREQYASTYYRRSD